MDKMKQIGYMLSARMAQLLYGRNGFDNLARVCYSTALILLLINLFADNLVIYFIWVVLFAYAVFRVFSKNIPKRYSENQKFLAITATPRKYLRFAGMQWRDRNTSRYYICNCCKQQIRVPKGKGRIEIKCPKCGNHFIKKT